MCERWSQTDPRLMTPPHSRCETLDKSFILPKVSCFLSKKVIMIGVSMFNEGIK